MSRLQVVKQGFGRADPVPHWWAKRYGSFFKETV
jgi:hypothetical protein